MQRFGSSNDRVVGLKGVYQEATAKNETDLEAVLRGYDEILRGNPTNMVGEALSVLGSRLTQIAYNEEKGLSSKAPLANYRSYQDPS